MLGGVASPDNLLVMVWELVSDLAKVMFMVPALFGIAGLIYYKCKVFTLVDPCENCSMSIQNFDEMHRQYCYKVCHFEKPGTHSESCKDFPKYASFMLRDICYACDKGSCTDNCCHALPVEAYDLTKLCLLHIWFAENVRINDDYFPYVIPHPAQKRFYEESAVLSYKHEESPKGERMTK